MTKSAHLERGARVRSERSSGKTLTQLAREFALSRTRIVQILEGTGGDPLGQRRRLQSVSVTELERERLRLRERIERERIERERIASESRYRMRSDRRRLCRIEDEISARQTDRILGFG